MELTDEQKQEVAAVFDYKETGEFTDDDAAVLAQMFDAPEKLLVLRKAFALLSDDERGVRLSGNIPEKRDDESYEEYGQRADMQRQIQEQLQARLLTLGKMTKDFKATELAAKFKENNRKAADEKARKEKLTERRDEENKTVGDNL